MDIYENVYKSICRLCLKQGNSEKMLSLVEESSSDGLSCYGKSVVTFANITINSNDILPTVMCVNCLFLLKQAIRFKFMCESSEKQLRQLVKPSSNVDHTDDEIREKIVQYTTFLHYFPEEHKENSSSGSKNEVKIIESSEENNKIETLDCTESLHDDDIPNEDLLEDGGDIDSPFDDFMASDLIDGDILLDRIDKLIGTGFAAGNLSKPRKRGKRKGKHNKKLQEQMRKQKLRMKKKSKEEKQENFICSICDRVLANQSTYDHHMQRHNGCRYMCEHCGRGFPVLHELQIHQVAKHGTGRYLQCEQCGFKAPRKFDLIEHERVHTGERPYACEKCGLTFRKRGIWKKHLIHHMEKKIQCPQCPRKFYLRGDMLAHANNVHERKYMYVCNKCGTTYAKSTTVRRHLLERHGIPREKQGKVIRINKGKDPEFSG